MDLTSQSIGMILIVFALCMAIAPLLINMLYKYGIVRKTETDFSTIVGERYLKEGTPIMGGLLIVITVVIATWLFNFNSATKLSMLVFVISAGLGGIDDLLNLFGKKRTPRTISKTLMLIKVHKSKLMRLWLLVTLPWNIFINIWFAIGSYPGRGLHAGEKIIIQTIAGALIAYWITFRRDLTVLWLPWYGGIDIGWLMAPLVMIAVISMTNAVNIADGMDGLASGSVLSAFFAFLVIALWQGDSAMALLNATTIGALLAYLYFNIKPARFQMGDVGSLALGALIASNALIQNRIALLPIIGGVFVVEVASSLVQGVYRRIFGRRLIKMAPLHLHFNVVGWSEEKVVMRFWLFSILCALLGLWLSLQ